MQKTVEIIVNNISYNIVCNKSDERKLKHLAELINIRIAKLKDDTPHIRSFNTILLFALLQLQEQNLELEKKLYNLQQNNPQAEGKEQKNDEIKFDYIYDEKKIVKLISEIVEIVDEIEDKTRQSVDEIKELETL